MSLHHIAASIGFAGAGTLGAWIIWNEISRHWDSIAGALGLR